MRSPQDLTLIQRMLRLRPYFNKPIKFWVGAVLFTLLVALIEPVIPALMQPLLDSGFKHNSFPLWMVPLVIIVLFSVRGFSVFLSLICLAKVASLGIIKIRSEMFDKLLHADLKLFKNESSSSLSNTLVYEVQNGAMLLVQSVLTVARDSLTVVTLLGYLLYLNWKLTLLVLLVFPAVTFIMKRLTKRLYNIVRKSQDATQQMAYVIEENVLAHRDIRLYNAEEKESMRFRKSDGVISQLFMKATAAGAAMTPLTQIATAIALSAVLTLALIQSAHSGTTVGSFTAFITAMLLVINPVKHLAEVSNQVTRGLASIERGIQLIENTKNEASGDFTKEVATGLIDFENACVQYEGCDHLAVDHLNLSILAGETVALVGASGSGKTTIANVLPRFVDLSSGQVLLDGVPVPQWDVKSLRAQFSLVSQHVFLLNDTIGVNICLGKALNEQQVWECLNHANLADYVKQLPKGIHTVVGHNAMQLSGGQRQRLAIARALYKNAPILILDEATSALDTESEKAIQGALDKLMENRTSIVIAHRLSTVLHADRIIVMQAGKIVEMGKHSELLALNGQYAKLYEMGLGGGVNDQP